MCILLNLRSSADSIPSAFTIFKPAYLPHPMRTQEPVDDSCVFAQKSQQQVLRLYVRVNVLKVVKMFLQSMEIVSCACSNRKCRARWPPLRSSGGPVESPGDEVLKERKLYYRRQCLHFAVCVLCRPVSPGSNQEVGRTRAQCLSIESAHRKVRLADALTPSEEHHDNPARRVRVRPSVPRRRCRRPSGRRDALVRRLYSDPSGVSLAHRDLMQSSGSGPRAKVPPGLAAIGGGR